MKPIIAGALVLVGCARDVTVSYPHATPMAGTIEVVLNDPTRTLTVAVNDALVVDRARTRRARIEGVPAGPARVNIASGGRCEVGTQIEKDVEVVPGMVTVIALPGPEPNTGCMIYSGLHQVAIYVGLLALAVTTLALGP